LNGGLSRYVKIRYFYEEILEKEITENEVLKYANEFSVLMKKELINPENLIQDSLQFIKDNYKKYHFHIVSGSDQEELRYLCKELGIDRYFLSIHGSPTPKNKLVKDLLNLYKYKLEETCLIGDSINDYEAAKNNNILFFGYNNMMLKTKVDFYLDRLNLILN
jgi:HAD superfamily hydrolase (TIGR01549 family)